MDRNTVLSSSVLSPGSLYIYTTKENCMLVDIISNDNFNINLKIVGSYNDNQLHHIPGQKIVSIKKSSLDKVLSNKSITLEFKEQKDDVKVERLFEESTGKTCCICMDRDKDICIVPCGHMFCEKCSYNIDKLCPLCKGLVERKLKTY